MIFYSSNKITKNKKNIKFNGQVNMYMYIEITLNGLDQSLVF